MKGSSINPGKGVRRRVLVISRDEQVGKWFRFILGGLYRGMPTTVASNLESALRALKRLRPGVVILVEENEQQVDDRLMLLEALLLLEKQSRENTVAILYSLPTGQLAVYHNIYLPHMNRDDVTQLVRETIHCPLFGCIGEEVHGFPKDCRFLPLMLKGVVEAATAAPSRTGAMREASREDRGASR